MTAYERMGLALPQAAAKSFDEFLLSLVLAQHPHNYSDELRGLSGTAAPRIVPEAEHWMRTGGPEVSVSKIAALLGVSLRSLEAGFREWRQNDAYAVSAEDSSRRGASGAAASVWVHERDFGGVRQWVLSSGQVQRVLQGCVRRDSRTDVSPATAARVHAGATVAMRRTMLDEIHRRIGRNLVRFQEIEFAFKFCLPYMHPKGSKLGVDALRQFQKAVRRKMLGELIGAFEECGEIPEGFFTQELKKTVDARNELIHYLFELPCVDLLSSAGGESLNRYLDEQFQAAGELHAFTRQLSLGLLLALQDSNPGLFAQLDSQYPGLLEKLRRATDAIEISSDPQ